MRQVLRFKIHKATVTEANLQYIGSISIDCALMEQLNIWEGEKVMVVDNTNGARLETYVIPAPKHSGAICMNGATAHLINVGDEIIIMGFEISEKPTKAKQILVDNHNSFVRFI